MAGIALREYQKDVVQRVGAALRKKDRGGLGARRVLVVVPPGGGKTVIAAFISRAFAERDQSVFFNCHRQELLMQTSLTFTKCGLAHGFVAPGHVMSAASLVNVASIDALKRRLANIKAPRVVIWDETHHIGAAGWAAIMEAWPETIHIGLTGTPWRLDGTGLGKYYEVMVEGPTVAELIEIGALSPYLLYAPDKPDMAGVKRSMGDFAKGESGERMKAPKLVGNIIAHWKKLAPGMRTVGFAVNRAHSKLMVERFNEAGIPAAHLDGDTPDGERKRIIQAFAAGTIQVLWNVDLFGEGFDLSAIAQRDVTIDCVILARPTQSLSLYLQQAMRCMRPAPGKVAIILDHAGNSDRHFFPDDEREWSLEGGKSKAANDNGPPPPVTCGSCFAQIRRKVPMPEKCPHCGAKLASKPKVANLEEGDGELVLKTDEEKARQRAARKAEEHEAKELGDLVALAVSRGYANPQKWAFKKWSNSRWRR
ncbi:DEAD/DEAH box helicase family protein [Bradyrhizobium sp. 613_E4_N2_2]|uniref:DEAD/DEAH box helicase n=1 Tax=Bradyrhizobium sp. 613_E4_N2_2 TaxID=3240371 RepID=UPI003F893463